MNICAGSSLIVAVLHSPSTCGSCSMNAQARFACFGSHLKGGALRRRARFRSSRKRRAASLIHLPWRAPFLSAAAAFA
jgi:hypothetical protein